MIKTADALDCISRLLILIFNQSVDKKSAQKPYVRAFA